MSRYTIFAVIAALCLATTHAAVTTASLTPASFAYPSGVVFQGATGGADELTWGTYTKAYFGPGTANSTVYAYGLKGSPVTNVMSRALNATILSNGTANTAAATATIGTDAVSGTVAYATGYKVALGLGSMAIAHVKSEGTPACPQLYVDIYNGGTAGALSSTKVTSNACAYCAGTATGAAGAGYDVTIQSLFYENSTYYVAYTTVLYTAAATASTSTPCSATTAALPAGTVGTDTSTVTLTGTLQGITATSPAAAKWTTAPNWFSQAASATPAIEYSELSGMCGPSNYTNSTTFYCAYSNGASPAVISNVAVTVADGTVGSAAPIATGTVVSGTAAQTTNTYSLAGFVHSQYQQGVLLNLLVTTYTAGPTASSYANTLQLYNLTSGASSTTGQTAGGIAITGYSNTVQTGQYAGDGITYGTGFALLTTYASDASTTNYQFAAFLANGTANGTAPSAFASGASGQSNAFIDANGGLWAGGYSLDTTLQTGNLGVLKAQIYSSGSILASFFALLSVMIAAVLAF